MSRWFKSCVLICVQAVQTVWVTTHTCTQPGSTSGWLAKSSRFIDRFCKASAQAYALILYAFYGEVEWFIHPFHTPNNKYYKGEYLI